jgi:GH3 auxin-responsive promoter
VKLLSPAISSLARMRMWRIEAWKNNPIEAQRDILQNLVTAAQYTEFGRKYNFSELFTLRAFKEAVPIHDRMFYGIRLFHGLPKAAVLPVKKANSFL